MSKERARFWKALSLMDQSGVPIIESLGIAAQEADEKLKSGISEVIQGVENRGSRSVMADAMEKHPETFSAFEVAMVKAGEISGDLGAVAEKLAEFFYGFGASS
jgi:type II secretory pathway component PulF